MNLLSMHGAMVSTAEVLEPLTFIAQDGYVTLRSVPVGTVIDWGDGSPLVRTTASPSHYTKTFGATQITGKIWISALNGFSSLLTVLCGDGLRRVTSWGDALLPPRFGFGSSYLTSGVLDLESRKLLSIPTDRAPPGVTDISTLCGASSLIEPMDISHWDVSTVTHFTDAFALLGFSLDVSQWDMSSAIDTQGMFAGSQFAGDVSAWDVSNVVNIGNIFDGCANFNSDVSGWDVSKNTNFTKMFRGCSVFNQDISGWNVSAAITIDRMFHNATSFNQDLSSWDVERFPSEPTSFSLNAAAWVLPKPLWGLPPADTSTLTSQVQAMYAKYSAVGGMWKFDDKSTLFQDAGLETPVTAVSDSVWSVADVSGNGNLLSNTGGTTRPLFNGAGVTPDGVDDYFQTASTLDLTSADKLLVGMSYTKIDDTPRMQMELGDNGAAAYSGRFYLLSGADGAINQDFYFGGNETTLLSSAVGFSVARANEYGDHLARGSIPDNLGEVFWNDVKATPDSTSDRLGGTQGNAVLNFFSRNAGSLLSNTPARRAIVLAPSVASAQVSDPDLEIIRQWLMEGA